MHYVYILYSSRLDKFYVGQTKDKASRIKRHLSGYENYTSRAKDWELLWSTTKPSLSAALILEKKLKNLSQKRLLELMLKYCEDTEGPDELLMIKQLSGC